MSDESDELEESDRPRYEKPEYNSHSCKPEKKDHSMIILVALAGLLIAIACVYFALGIVDMLEEKGVSFVEYYGERKIIFSVLFFSVFVAILIVWIKAMVS